MAKKRRKKYQQFPVLRSKFDLPQGTKAGILVIILFTLGIISFLGLVDLAGSLGVYINDFLKYLFGGVRFYVPLTFIIFGYFLMRPEKFVLNLSNFLGLFLFILSFNGLIHLIRYPKDIVLAAQQGQGGGYLGIILSWPLFKTMGYWATLVVLAALSLVGIFLVFNTSFNQLFSRLNKIKSFFERINNFIWKIRIKLAQKRKEKLIAQATPPLPEQAPEFVSKEMKEPEGKEQKTEEEKEAEQLSLEILKFKRKKIDLPLDLLNGEITTPTSGDIKANKYIIQKTLENFGIPVEMGEVNVGPTVTQYTLRPAEGIKLSRIITLNNDLSLALAAHPIRIEAPIPGRSLVGIEVPNQSFATVPLRVILSSEDFKNRQSNLTVALGVDVKGKPWLADLGKMPHLLIAGATGSGKSVCIKAIITSLLYQNSPGELKFILVDPKRVELPIYNGIPHLLTPVITEVKKTVNALKWTISEMEHRFDILSEAHKRDIQVYNQEFEEKLPYIIIIIDELADLMAAAGAEIEACVVRLAQMSRATGIHLVVATQRPSVDILTGLIKANITSRIAFSVASLVDSRTILDMSGAEKLLGRGDMLFVSAEISKPKRLQGAFISDQEIKKIIDYLKNQAEPEYLEEVILKQPVIPSFFENIEEGGDELLPEAKEVILQAGKASASLLQRRLKIGYARAARILDLLEEQGIIGPVDGAKPREILTRYPQDDIIKDSSEDKT